MTSILAACSNPSSWDSNASIIGQIQGPSFSNGSVAKPVFAPPAGSYSSDQSVTLSCSSPGAKLYYTTDGSTPISTSTLYIAGTPILITGIGSTTIRVLAVKAGFADGSAAAAYTINPAQVSMPQFLPLPGTYGADQGISLSCSTAGAVLHYTTGPSMALTADPTALSAVYLSPIPVAGNFTNMAIKVLAVKAGLADNSASGLFTINYPGLTMMRIGNGNTFPTSPMTSPHPAGTFPITATPLGGSHFVNWTFTGGAIVDFPNNIAANATLSSSGTVTANFALDQYTLTPAIVGIGTMNPSTPTLVDSGVPTPITAAAGLGWVFANWGTSGGSTVDLMFDTVGAHATLLADSTVTAYFNPNSTRMAVADSTVGGYIYTSADGGATWTATQSSGAGKWGALAASANGMIIIASTGAYDHIGDLWRSTDGGVTWNPLSSIGASSYWAAVACSADGQKIAVAEYLGAERIHVSSDGGSTWSTGTSPTAFWSSISMSTDGSKLLAGAGGGASPLYKSTDGGFSWSSCDALGYQWTASRISPDGTQLFGAEINTGVTSGRIWTVPTSGGSLTMLPASALTFYNQIALSSTGSKIAAVDFGTGTGGYIRLSSDSGATWNLQATPGFARWNSVSSSLDGMRLVACADDHETFWTSTDGGNSWLPITIGSGHSWSSVVIQQ